MGEGVKDQKTERMSSRSLEKSQHIEQSAPDDGWGWMIVAGCFLTTVCTRGVTRFVHDETDCYFSSNLFTSRLCYQMSGNENVDRMGNLYLILYFFLLSRQDKYLTKMSKRCFRSLSHFCALQVCVYLLCGVPDIFFQRLFRNCVDPLSAGLHYNVVW